MFRRGLVFLWFWRGESEELQHVWIIPHGFPVCHPCDSVGRSGQMCHPHCTAWQIEGFWYTLRITMVSEFCGYHFTPNSIVVYYKKITSVIQISRTCFFWGTSTASAKCQLRWKINTSDHAEPAGPSQNEQTTSSQHVSFQTSTFHSTCIYINYVSWWTMMNNDERSRQYN